MSRGGPIDSRRAMASSGVPERRRKCLMRRVFSLLSALLLVCLTLPAGAQEMSKAQRAEMLRFAHNNSLFVLYHEVAHLLFDQLDLPVLGREEDAADNVATWILLNKNTPEARQALIDAAQGWFYSGIAYNSGGYESDFAAGYSLDKQRAYQIVCLMVGMDRTAFRHIANKYELLPDRQDSCGVDYEMIDRSWTGLFAAHQATEKPATVSVSYRHASGKLRAAADALRRSGMLESVAGELRALPLPRPVRINARRCGEANAFYDSDAIEVIFCYELMQDYMDLYADNRPAEEPEPQRRAGSSRSKLDAF